MASLIDPPPRRGINGPTIGVGIQLGGMKAPPGYFFQEI